jgi:hypothetical protein
LIPCIADSFETAILAGPIVLPVVRESFAGMPVEIYCPEADKVKGAFDGSFLDGFEFFRAYSRQLNLLARLMPLIHLIMCSNVKQDNDFTIRFRILFN